MELHMKVNAKSEKISPGCWKWCKKHFYCYGKPFLWSKNSKSIVKNLFDNGRLEDCFLWVKLFIVKLQHIVFSINISFCEKLQYFRKYNLSFDITTPFWLYRPSTDNICKWNSLLLIIGINKWLNDFLATQLSFEKIFILVGVIHFPNSSNVRVCLG